jgi:hypothetical protein
VLRLPLLLAHTAALEVAKVNYDDNVWVELTIARLYLRFVGVVLSSLALVSQSIRSFAIR